MESFRWGKHFVTGILEVDQQHHHLLDIINQFANLLSENRQASDDIEALLKEISDYAQYHFQEEQKLMSNIGIDRRFLRLQVKEHQSYVQEIVSMWADISPDSPEAAKHLLDFLTQWLVYHILGTDQSMARQIKTIQSGASPGEAYEAEERGREDATKPLVTALKGLFEQVSDRNKKLAQANIEITQAQEEAEVANQAKSYFLANVSHELRTPMNHIMAFIDIVLSSEIGEKQKGYLQKARSSSNNLLTIINNIVNFSQMDKDELSIEVADFWLDDICQDLITSFTEQADEKGLKLEIDGSDSVPLGLIGDQKRLFEILTNLVDNAIKFTQSGHVAIERKLISQEDDRLTLQFAVRDTGIGISEEGKLEIFEAFTQGDASSSRAYGGTGVGLAISKKLVELMGGKIWAESTPGNGSSFYFTADFTLSHTAHPRKKMAPTVKAENEMDLTLDDAPSEHSDKQPAADPAKLMELLLILDYYFHL